MPRQAMRGTGAARTGSDDTGRGWGFLSVVAGASGPVSSYDFVRPNDLSGRGSDGD